MFVRRAFSVNVFNGYRFFFKFSVYTYLFSSSIVIALYCVNLNNLNKLIKQPKISTNFSLDLIASSFWLFESERR